MKIFIIGAYPRSLINFRGQLISLLVGFGWHVTSLSSGANVEEIKSIKNLGSDYIDYKVKRNGLNPFNDINTLISFFCILKRNSPDVILAYTIKPIIWGGIAARLLKHNNFNALITGLGYAFQSGGFFKNILVFIVVNLYRIALKNAKSVIFQNHDNMNLFIDKGIVDKSKCYVVNGSGVDLKHFKLTSLTKEPNFLLIARLLGDKGIREYVKAAKLIKGKYPNALFELVGPEDPSIDGITIDRVNKWTDSGYIQYKGSSNDVRPFIKKCNIFVLPSYHEGMPRTVLEAMAMGRPILTTDVPGCRETVMNGENGWLVEKANFEQLAERMIWFIENQDQWKVMGQKSYSIANEKFDVHKVNAEILKIMGISNEKTF
ncbi:glycosyltransferase family 4 protein [Photobacterium kishitanii]|uniref:Glycosyltransferase family 1 protein n=2 Tax=Photobacterium kishitanii TaxID=318456 RepID=A0AAX0YVJ8_9GAMM|nr:glycosyltransferase family 4 protein [Photobacterium kishitanii]KJG64694.1 glycosyl transferase family 1 [Photobacterium kishitanii]KJG68907.1 glycosyl transferase family 1 [Photobacterium kishitanii]PSX18835.1 glycosyltransferase family 1 protein [Photobacterium kishitanii]PSX27128.1 glycosyltransferase family 1 protein [Photobacterium kishitanii]PSX30648.1 glycosyltransferase family 1 protein [Photobacterium kishitanii]